jgi:short-subunit dehydrogenase
LIRPVTLITGASAGIGASLAHVFAAHGHELVLIARREQRLVDLADAIAATGHQTRDVEPEIVINNAGFGLVGDAASLDRAEQLSMIDVNVRTLTDLSLAFVDSLERRRGGILNVASIAGFLPGPGMAVYHATKAFVLSFSEALHSELALTESAEAVAEQAYRGLRDGQRLVVPGLGNKAVTVLTRLVPRAVVLAALQRRNRQRSR